MEAANQMTSKKAKRRIVAYVESYDDVFFWRTVLSRFESEKLYFEVMLPSKKTLQRGKKSVLMNFIDGRVGPDMIACVDADYDYLMQGQTESSQKVLQNKYVFHTYVYAIENYQCYAESLHNVAVMVTLNDHRMFDFVSFLHQYSETCFPLFVWSVLIYREGLYDRFSISDFNRVIELGGFDIAKPEEALRKLRGKVGRRINWLQQNFSSIKDKYGQVKSDVKRLGVTPTTTYLYIQGHHLFDIIVTPIMGKLCNRLRTERENEISRTAIHRTQRNNELSCYENSLADVKQMLKKNMGYMQCPEFLRLQDDVDKFLKE